MTSELAPVITCNVADYCVTLSSIHTFTSYYLAWHSFKKWHDSKFYHLNEERFLNSGFVNQQGYLIMYLRHYKINLHVYRDEKCGMWVACINSNEVDYHKDYDTALLAAITKGFQLTEDRLILKKVA